MEITALFTLASELFGDRRERARRVGSHLQVAGSILHFASEVGDKTAAIGGQGVEIVIAALVVRFHLSHNVRVCEVLLCLKFIARAVIPM